MKKKLIILVLALVALPVFANEETLVRQQTVQNRIDDCGAHILNANQISKPVMFVYNDTEANSLLKFDTTLTSRQIIVYKDGYQFIENDDELAAYLSRAIVLAVRSYEGMFNGVLRSLQIKASPKKFEIVSDKIAVDYMVKAGYNPLALITYIQKTAPQKRYDLISNKNLTSKRLAIIYEYIYTKYPYYLKHNEYLKNVHYQNFLSNSQNNRKMLAEKIKMDSKEKLKYE